MSSVRRKVAVMGFLALTLTGLLAQPVAAVHQGAIVDCGSAGTFTIKTSETPVGLFPPGLGDVLVFEERGTLTVQTLYADGQLIFDFASAGRLHWKANEATCSFYGADGTYFEITGVLTAR